MSYTVFKNEKRYCILGLGRCNRQKVFYGINANIGLPITNTIYLPTLNNFESHAENIYTKNLSVFMGSKKDVNAVQKNIVPPQTPFVFLITRENIVKHAIDKLCSRHLLVRAWKLIDGKKFYMTKTNGYWEYIESDNPTIVTPEGIDEIKEHLTHEKIEKERSIIVNDTFQLISFFSKNNIGYKEITFEEINENYNEVLKSCLIDTMGASEGDFDDTVYCDSSNDLYPDELKQLLEDVYNREMNK